MNTNDYTTRILSATPLKLVIITYELAIKNISEAIKTDILDHKQKNISKSRDCLKELIINLNPQIEISKNLYSIYIYINKLLISADIKCDLKKLNKIDEINNILYECWDLLEILLFAWNEIDLKDKSDPINYFSKIFAGLTYKNNKLSEYVDEASYMNFKA